MGERVGDACGPEPCRTFESSANDKLLLVITMIKQIIYIYICIKTVVSKLLNVISIVDGKRRIVYLKIFTYKTVIRVIQKYIYFVKT